VSLALLGGILTLLEYLRSRRGRQRQPEPVSHGRAA